MRRSRRTRLRRVMKVLSTDLVGLTSQWTLWMMWRWAGVLATLRRASASQKGEYKHARAVHEMMIDCVMLTSEQAIMSTLE